MAGSRVLLALAFALLALKEEYEYQYAATRAAAAAAEAEAAAATDDVVVDEEDAVGGGSIFGDGRDGDADDVPTPRWDRDRLLVLL